MAEQETIESIDEQTAATEEAATPSPKKGKKKLAIVAGVVAVIVVLGAGLWVWHEQPEFCNAICHTPMDAYGATYLDGNVDKYGNELNEQQALAMMSYNHKVNADAKCMSCHLPVLSQQIGEATEWITGNYEINGENKLGQALLAERSLDELAEPIGLESGTEFCLRDGCHVKENGTVMTRDDLLDKTKGLSDKYNPHKTQHGEVACGQCHKGHSQSVNYCTQCHAEAPVPEGWLTYQQAQSIAK